MNIQNARMIFNAHNGIMKTKEIHQSKIYSHYLSNLIKQGHVHRIRQGYYQWKDERIFSETVVITSLFPDAVLCRESAMQYYGYSDRTPDAWYLAVDRDCTRSRFKLDYPIVKPVLYSSEQMEMGVESVLIDSTPIKIFNREHIICDCLRHQNTMDAEIFNKAIQGYIKDSNKNIPRLMEYAKLLHTEKKVRSMIGIWL
ncbi:MAG: type IV toxin-antitoxin system AbiEi family antitoxin domain-containing protein [Sphaerochaetaceae bacterium]